jgi:hypothetical protein
LTAKAAKKFRKVREEERAFQDCTTTEVARLAKLTTKVHEEELRKVKR